MVIGIFTMRSFTLCFRMHGLSLVFPNQLILKIMRKLPFIYSLQRLANGEEVCIFGFETKMVNGLCTILFRDGFLRWIRTNSFAVLSFYVSFSSSRRHKREASTGV